MKKSDVPLLLLYSDNCKPINTYTKFQKLLFMTQKNALDKILYLFYPDRFGPSDSDLDDELEFLKSINMVKQDGHSYSITEKGKRFVEQKSIPRSHNNTLAKINKIKTTFGRKTLTELLKHMYIAYPEYVIKADILGKR